MVSLNNIFDTFQSPKMSQNDLLSWG